METIKAPSISPPSIKTNEHDVGMVLQDTGVRQELPAPLPTLQQQPEPHPLAEFFGKFEGKEWEEFLVQMKKNREQDDKEAAGN